jgi:hypothetical protein
MANTEEVMVDEVMEELGDITKDTEDAMDAQLKRINP